MKRALFPLLIIPAVCGLCGCLSCSVNPDVVALWGGEASPPSLVSVTPVSTTRVEIRFSGPVTVVEAAACLSGKDAEGFSADLDASWSPLEPSDSVVFEFASPVGVGSSAVIDASVADASGNTLSFAVPFTGYNDRPARLAFNEIRTGYSKPKAEYVELLVLESGNLGGILIENARNEKVPIFELPAAEALAGEYVVWHLRSVDAGLITELRALDESAGVDSCPTARDLWDDQSSAPLKATNVLLLRTRAGGSLQDALLTAESAVAAWPSDSCRAAAEEAFSSGLWPSGSTVANAVPSDGMSPTRTLGKTPAGGWAVCPTGKCSPGRDNWLP